MVLGGLVLLARSIAPMDPCASACEFLPRLRWVVGLGAAIALALCLFYVDRALRVWRTGQAPPPGTWVLLRTRVYTGGRATFTAISNFIFSAGVACLLASLVYYLVVNDLLMLMLGLEPCT